MINARSLFKRHKLRLLHVVDPVASAVRRGSRCGIGSVVLENPSAQTHTLRERERVVI